MGLICELTENGDEGCQEGKEEGPGAGGRAQGAAHGGGGGPGNKVPQQLGITNMTCFVRIPFLIIF